MTSSYLQTLLKPIDGIYSHGECEPLDLDMSVFHNKQQVYMLRIPLMGKHITSLTLVEVKELLKEYQVVYNEDDLKKVPKYKQKYTLIKILCEITNTPYIWDGKNNPNLGWIRDCSKPEIEYHVCPI